MRQLVLDIETTGMNKSGILYQNHRIIEIGIIELINRKKTGNFLHYYLQPDCKIDIEAYKVHGISDKFLINKPRFRDVFKNILKFLNNSEIIVHNASFDISFLNYEFNLLNLNIKKICNFCKILDTLLLARKLFPGKKNSLRALCSRYKINDKNKKLHGALLDAKLLTKVYLYLTIKQETIFFPTLKKSNKKDNNFYVFSKKKKLKILYANKKELLIHKKYLYKICNKKDYNFW